MTIRVAINGFGRIGRMVFKAALADPDIDVVAVNDLTDTRTLANLFKYDSVHGIFPHTVEAGEGRLVIDGKTVVVHSKKDPEELPWKDADIDCVIESTGLFRTRSLASKHITGGAKKVLVSAPCKCEIDGKTTTCPAGESHVKTIVLGINEHEIDKDKDIILSNASCTTNCAAPMFKVLDDNFKVRRGSLTTIHAYTADQRIVDAPHKDLRRGRSAAINIIPTTTGAAKAVEEVIPGLAGKLDGIAVRVPVPDGSFTDITVEVERETSVEDINALFKSVSENHLKGVLQYTEDPLVSSDIVGNHHSVIFDASMTKVLGGNLIKVFGWYDNEYGYACRMIDVVKKMF